MWPFKPKPPQMVTVCHNGAREVNIKLLLESPQVREQLRQLAKFRPAHGGIGVAVPVKIKYRPRKS
jgi:hypothetical protein